MWQKRDPSSQGSPPQLPPREWWTRTRVRKRKQRRMETGSDVCQSRYIASSTQCGEDASVRQNTPPGTAVNISLQQKPPEADNYSHTELTCWGRSKYPYHWHLLHVALPEFRVAHVQVFNWVCQVVVSRDDPHGEHDCRHRCRQKKKKEKKKRKKKNCCYDSQKGLALSK